MPENSTSVAKDVNALIRARNPLLWVVTPEEGRVEPYLFEAATKAGYVPRTWDVAQGFQTMAGENDRDNDLNPDLTKDIGSALSAILARSKRGDGAKNSRGVWIMRDVPAWLEGPIGMVSLRQLRNLARSLPSAPRDSAQAIVIISPRSDVPPELANHATVINWPLPDRSEIGEILIETVQNSIRGLDESVADIDSNDDPAVVAAVNKFLNGEREPAIDAAIGLSGEEAAACYSRSIVQKRKLDIGIVAGEKKRIIAKAGLIEWIDPLPGGMDAVGGLDILKGWLIARKDAYSPDAREYGLPAPKGCCLVGVSGCGKSLLAKAISTFWGVPNLKIDPAGLKGKYVGESEQNLRKVLRTIEAIGRCVVWLDEIEKALSGGADGVADGGVSMDQIGTLLTWMQERKGEAFIIATSNDVSRLPPELLRKGRFDELWWVDVPTQMERVEILLATLRAYGRDATVFRNSEEIALVASKCEGFTGSEVASLVPDALYIGYADGKRPITGADLIAVAKNVVPLTQTKKEEIDKQRLWAQDRARFATSAQEDVVRAIKRPSQGRAVDL